MRDSSREHGLAM